MTKSTTKSNFGSNPDHPNIVFILADDLGAWALGCSGNTEVITPHLDRLSKEGMRFEQFFCASPVCSPARASILTGKLPSQHGVHDWIRAGNIPRSELSEPMREHNAYALEHDNAIEYLAEEETYTELLAQHGYTCALSGKWHLGNSTTPHRGFNKWFTIAQGGGSYMKPHIVKEGKVEIAEQYVTDLITDQAIHYVEELAQEERPFYLSVHYTAPHSPWNRSEHPESFFQLYNDCPFESVPELPEHPDQSPTCPRGQGEARKELLRGYYASITAMDEGIGKLIDKLEELNIREHTLIIFMSDNGMNMGHHGIWGKGNGTFPLNMYDTSVKVPAIFSQPGVIPQDHVSQELVSQYDLFPTLLEYAGISQTDSAVADTIKSAALPGKSFVSLLKGDGPAHREHVVVLDEYGPVRMLRTKEWKYVHRYPYGPHELYHLAQDPEEQINLIQDPSYSEQLSEMRSQLTDWFRQYVRPDMDGVYSPVTGFGQMDKIRSGNRESNVFHPGNVQPK